MLKVPLVTHTAYAHTQRQPQCLTTAMITHETGSCELGAECSSPHPPSSCALYMGAAWRVRHLSTAAPACGEQCKNYAFEAVPSQPTPRSPFRSLPALYPSRGVLRIFVRQLRDTERERERVELIKYMANTWNGPAGPRPELNYTELGWAGLDEAGNRNWLMGRPALRLRLPRRAGNMHGLSPAQHLAISSKWAKMNTKQRRKKFECALSGRIGSFVGLCCCAGGACATDQKVKNLPCCNLADFFRFFAVSLKRGYDGFAVQYVTQ